MDKYRLLGVEFNFFDPDGAVPEEMKDGCDYEPSLTNFINYLIKSGEKSFIDVGAHYGYFTTLCGKLSENIKIHSFEPSPIFQDILNRNINENNIKATVHGVALSDSTGIIKFQNRTMKVSPDTDNEIIDIESVTFDNYIKDNHIEADIVKIDVHGAEGKVLFGMKKSLESSVKHIFIEIHAQHLLVDYGYNDIFTLLNEKDFIIYELEEFRYLNTPKLRLLTDIEIKKFSDYSTWTEEDVSSERMIYACKKP